MQDGLLSHCEWTTGTTAACSESAGTLHQARGRRGKGFCCPCKTGLELPGLTVGHSDMRGAPTPPRLCGASRPRTAVCGSRGEGLARPGFDGRRIEGFLFGSCSGFLFGGGFAGRGENVFQVAGKSCGLEHATVRWRLTDQGVHPTRLRRAWEIGRRRRARRSERGEGSHAESAFEVTVPGSGLGGLPGPRIRWTPD